MSYSPVCRIAWRYTIDFPKWEEEKDQLILWLRKEATNWIFQLECTEVESQPEREAIELFPDIESEFWSYNVHFQGYARLRDKERTGTIAKRLNAAFRGIWIAPASHQGDKALQSYCLKAHSRVHGPWADHPIYSGQDLPLKHQLYPWQKWVTAYCLKPVIPRQILWIVDLQGGTGKSAWRKYMAFHHKAVCLEYDSAANLRYQATQETNRQMFLVNLTRAKPKDYADEDLYSALETIKDGHVRSNKYTGGGYLDLPPHIVVLSNIQPNHQLMSRDRFLIKHVNPQTHAFTDQAADAPVDMPLSQLSSSSSSSSSSQDSSVSCSQCTSVSDRSQAVLRDCDVDLTQDTDMSE